MTETHKGTLETGKTYSLMVTGAQCKAGPFSKKGIPGYYNHLITFVGALGELYQAEYIVQSQEQNDFRKGIKQQFYVDNNFFAGKVPQIKPGIWHLNVGNNTVTPEMENAPQQKVERPNLPIPDRRYAPVSVSGQSYVFAMAYAKDILVAKISAGLIEDPEDITSMLTDAKIINNALLEMQQEQLNRTNDI